MYLSDSRILIGEDNEVPERAQRRTISRSSMNG